MAATIEEMTPRYGWRSYAVSVLMIELLILTLFSPVILTATWPHIKEALTVFAGAGLFTLPLALLCGWSHQVYNRTRSGWVTYANGTLSSVVDSNVLSVPLANCRWYYGNSTRATIPCLRLLLKGGGPAVLIEFPSECQTHERTDKGRAWPPGPVIVAVGFDSISRRAWEDVLQDSGASHDLARQSMPAPLSGYMWVLFALLAIPSSVLAGVYGSTQVAKWLAAVGVPQEIANACAFPLFVPGTLCLVGYCFMFVLLRERRCYVTTEQREATVAPLRPGVEWLAPLALILFGVWFPGHLDLTSKVLMTAVTLLLSSVVAWHFHVLLKDPRSGCAE